jgi:Cof subfamily protein (haloacid dehalogenase superfamily)
MPKQFPCIRLLAIDIDGTLVNSDHELTQATRSAILRAKRAGIHIVLATGRRYSRVLPLVEPLELNVPLITASGALIKRACDHLTLFRAQFRPGSLELCLRSVAAAGFTAVLYGDTYDQGFDYYQCPVASPGPLLSEFFDKNVGFGRHWPGLMSAPPQGVFACFAMGTRDEMSDVADRLRTELSSELTVHVLRSPRYLGYMCEIAPSGVSKWTGVTQLAKSWHISAQEICAVGDDVNDIPMLEGAGLGVAMGNALPEVQAAADRIAPGNDEDGLVQVVDWILSER